MVDWYEGQRRRDAESRKLSESLLGPEQAVFSKAMELMARCLDTVFASDQINDPVIKRQIGYAQLAFNLLWAAWDQMLAGRYNAASQLERTIDELSDFLQALFINPDLADETPAGKLDVDKARRAIRDALDRRQPGTGKRWLAERRRVAKSFQPFSHVSPEAIARVPVAVEGGRKYAMVSLGGAVAEPTLRLFAVNLASTAMILMPAAVLAFVDIPGVESLWERLPGFCNNSGAELSRVLEQLQFPSGEVDHLILLPSDEVTA